MRHGKPCLPDSVKYGVVDGAVRATFISEEAPDLVANFSIWVFPDVMFKDLHLLKGSEEGKRRSCLTTVLTTIAQRLNQSSYSGAKSSFAQKIEEVSRRRTAECSNMK